MQLDRNIKSLRDAFLSFICQFSPGSLVPATFMTWETLIKHTLFKPLPQTAKTGKRWNNNVPVCAPQPLQKELLLPLSPFSTLVRPLWTALLVYLVILSCPFLGHQRQLRKGLKGYRALLLFSQIKWHTNYDGAFVEHPTWTAEKALGSHSLEDPFRPWWEGTWEK